MLHTTASELAMMISSSKRPSMCRLVTIALGVTLFSLGVRTGALPGLLLMMVGLVPTVIGVAGVSVLNEIRDERAHQREQQAARW